MRKSILPFVFIAAFGAAGAAFAEDATSRVKAIDAAAMSVTLDDGAVYKFDNSDSMQAALGGIRVGNKVHIVWSDMNGTRSAETISPVDN
jgi:Cu/Ag efflux protein CusF